MYFLTICLHHLIPIILNLGKCLQSEVLPTLERYDYHYYLLALIDYKRRKNVINVLFVTCYDMVPFLYNNLNICHLMQYDIVDTGKPSSNSNNILIYYLWKNKGLPDHSKHNKISQSVSNEQEQSDILMVQNPSQQ